MEFFERELIISLRNRTISLVLRQYCLQVLNPQDQQFKHVYHHKLFFHLRKYQRRLKDLVQTLVVSIIPLESEEWQPSIVHHVHCIYDQL